MLVSILVFSLKSIGYKNKALLDVYNVEWLEYLNANGLGELIIESTDEQEVRRKTKEHSDKINADPGVIEIRKQYKAKVFVYEKELFRYVLLGLCVLWAVLFYVFAMNRFDVWVLLMPVCVGYLLHYISFGGLTGLGVLLFLVQFLVVRAVR